MVRRISTTAIIMAMIASTLVAPSFAADKAMVITITRNGARSSDVSGDETVALCAMFRLSRQDVKEFFTRSRRVTLRDYNHGLEMSRCHVAGRISYPNGTRGRWWIDMERRGMLILGNGRRSYYYCPACTSRRFDVPYDPAIDG